MSAILIGIFLVLHGLVHLLYFGQSSRYFELQTGMVWPDGSWTFSRLFGDEMTRPMAGAACGLAAAGFIIGGVGLLGGQVWWRPVAVSVAIFSSILYLLFWDGKMQELPNQGAVGILINVIILIAVFVLQWPNVQVSS